MSTELLIADSQVETVAAGALACVRDERLQETLRPRGRSGNQTLRTTLCQALDMLPDAVFFLTPTMEIVGANAAATKTLGYSRRELKSRNFKDLVETGSASAVLDRVECLLSRGKPRRRLAAQLSPKQDAACDVWLNFKLVEQTAGALIIVTAGRRTRTKRRDAGMRDYLTGLPTRAALDERLRKAERRSRRSRDQYAILFIDANGFKQVNDRSGHRVGDFVLQAFARRLRACVRPADFVARYGGDEFVALIEDVHSMAEVRKIAARIRAELKAEIEVGGGVVNVSVSVGVALGDVATTAQEALAAADRAMYRAKRRYRTAQWRGRLVPLGDWT